MQQQFAVTARIMVVVRAFFVWRNVEVFQKEFLVFESGIGVTKINPACPQAFHFRARQHDARLEAFKQFIFKSRSPVGVHAGHCTVKA